MRQRRILFGLIITVSLLVTSWSLFARQNASFSNHYKFLRVEDDIDKLPIPEVYTNSSMKRPQGISATCAKYPSIFDLRYNNIYWQELITPNATFYLMNAYYDDRLKTKYVRIISMITTIDPVNTSCQLWFANKDKPLVVQSEYDYMWNKSWTKMDKNIEPFLISCPVPSALIPNSVSLVKDKCDTSTTNLKIIYESSKEKEGFAICLKGLDYENDNFSIRLIEWLELVQILGAKKVHMSYLRIQKNVSKILAYYKINEKITLDHFTLPGPKPNIGPIQHKFLSDNHRKQIYEIIPYNNCFYKNMNKYKYIALLDVDEVIMPYKKISWKEMMASIHNNWTTTSEPDTFRFQNTWFMDDLTKQEEFQTDVPSQMHILQHVYRVAHHTNPEHYPKSFFDTSKVKTLQHHWPFRCLPDRKCNNYFVDLLVGDMCHYRKYCTEGYRHCEEIRNTTIKDGRILRYKHELISNVKEVVQKLGLDIK